MAAPIPELAPVTTATLSLQRCILKQYEHLSFSEIPATD
jgi:hypothetical protein